VYGVADGLRDDEALHASAVVANSGMNRERQLDGANSYTRELGFNPLAWLVSRLDTANDMGWLDLCCGAGRALGQAAARLADDGLTDRVTLVGVDLVDYFDAVPGRGLDLICAPVLSWIAPRRFDLITCVHGLHYVGDKLALLVRVASWLADGGQFVADLDLASIRVAGGAPAGRPLADALRRAGFRYDSRRRRMSRTGPAELRLPFAYLGADDRPGPNYTGQPAVNSYYRRA
jgi:SAM-dependent methyltransferase